MKASAMLVEESVPRILRQARTADGVGLQLRRDSSGVLEVPGLESVLVCLHIGPPAKLSCQRDGRWLAGTSVHGDIDIIPANTAMRWEMHDEHDAGLILSLPPALLRRVAEEADLNPSGLRIWDRFQIRDTELETLGWSMKRELELGCPSGRLYLDGLTLAAASRVVARHSSLAGWERRKSGANGDAPGGLGGRRLKAVLAYIEEQLAEGLSLARLAAVAGVSASHFKTAFRASTGVAVHQYVIQRRVERAKALMMRDGLSMAEVAAASGFAHQSHMARHMRRALGMAPRSIKRMLVSGESARS